MAASGTTGEKTAAVRLASIDVYRGFVMFLLMAEALHFAAVAQRVPGNNAWHFLAQQQSHVEWVGCVLHDMIQPSFTFLVGVALPFSIASRRSRGQSPFWMTAHAFWRMLILIFLGIFLRSIGHAQTYFTFEDTLTQIGLGYGMVFLLGFRPGRDQWIALALILLGYWAAFAFYPSPADFDYSKVGVSAGWLSQHGLHGFAAHWNKNSNAAWAFDRWFLNLFPREKPFAFNGGGYSTLSFIPTLGTMVLGLLAGGTLRSDRTPWQKVRWLVTAGALTLVAGMALHQLGVCPVVKRIWTPSWTLFSGGLCLLTLAFLYIAMDIWNGRFFAFPLIVIGMNSIVAYCSDWLFTGFIASALRCHLGDKFFKMFGEPYEPFVLGACQLLVLWLMLFWMYRKKIFIRI